VVLGLTWENDAHAFVYMKCRFKWFHGSLYLQVKLISAHQAEIQFVKNMLMKIMGSGEGYSGLQCFWSFVDSTNYVFRLKTVHFFFFLFSLFGFWTSGPISKGCCERWSTTTAQCNWRPDKNIPRCRLRSWWLIPSCKYAWFSILFIIIPLPLHPLPKEKKTNKRERKKKSAMLVGVVLFSYDQI
jgi:hypothetical protein